ncbi:MAG: hotdog domain-containing protein [Ilumatobacter sp.]|nr:hotdog domain-containing protein [Ilumatobacter sp.]MDG2040001.1 hotdog domain-containing protein [Ilumatobacter sp.]NKB41377.1 thioesterase [Ilumatobacter sp.]
MVETGMRGTASLVVSEFDTSVALGSGDINVLGTPRLIALCEAATVSALADQLDDSVASVGMRIRVDHLQPTPVGVAVTAEAVLDKIDGRRLTFTVSVSDTGGLVAAGKITRALVDRASFLDKCCTA